MITIYDLKGNAAPLVDNGEIELSQKLNAVDQITLTAYNWPDNKLSYPMITERAVLELPDNGQKYRILNREESNLGDLKAWHLTALHVIHDLNDKYLHNDKKTNKDSNKDDTNDNKDKDAEPEGVELTLEQFMAYITKDTKFTYTIHGDFGTHVFADNPKGRALDLFLNEGLYDYGYEFIVDNYHIDIYHSIGQQNAFVFVDNGNVSKITSTYDDSTITTHIKGECAPLVTKDDVDNDQSALDDAQKDLDTANKELSDYTSQYNKDHDEKSKEIIVAQEKYKNLKDNLVIYQQEHSKDEDYNTQLESKNKEIADAAVALKTAQDNLSKLEQQNQKDAADKNKVVSDATTKHDDAQTKLDKDQKVYIDSGADGDTVYGEYTSPRADIYGIIDANYYTDDHAHTKGELQQDLPKQIQDYPKMSITLECHEFEKNATLKSINDISVGNYGFIKDRFDIDITSRIVETIKYLQSPDNKEPTLTFGTVLGDFSATMATLSANAIAANNAGAAMPGATGAVVSNFFANAKWTEKDVTAYDGRSWNV